MDASSHPLQQRKRTTAHLTPAALIEECAALRLVSPADEPWARTSDRNVWRAYRNGLVLTVTRLAGGSGWQATVESPGTTERSEPKATRLAAQSWAGNRAGDAW